MLLHWSCDVRVKVEVGHVGNWSERGAWSTFSNRSSCTGVPSLEWGVEEGQVGMSWEIWRLNLRIGAFSVVTVVVEGLGGEATT